MGALALLVSLCGVSVAPLVHVETPQGTTALPQFFRVTSPGGRFLESANTTSSLTLHVAADDRVPRVSEIKAFELPGGIEIDSGRFSPALYFLLHHETAPEEDVAHVLPTTMQTVEGGKVLMRSPTLQPDGIQGLYRRLRSAARTTSQPTVYVGVVLYIAPLERRFYPVQLVLKDEPGR